MIISGEEPNPLKCLSNLGGIGKSIILIFYPLIIHSLFISNKCDTTENTFFRFKNSFGSRFLSRDDDNMRNEMTIKCKLLNTMFEIGKRIYSRRPYVTVPFMDLATKG